MPPQPLSRIKPGLKYRLHFDNFDERPAVAQAIAECIATWSRVECAYGHLFISLLQTNERKGAELYASFDSGHSKRVAITALAVGSLHEQKVELLRRLISHTNSQEKIRNKIAHWIWGTADELKDSMVICDPKSIWAHTGKNLSGIRAKPGEMFLFMPYLDSRVVFSYSKRDLQEDAKAFASLAVLVEKFPFFLAQDTETQQYASLYNELIQDARLAKPEDQLRPAAR
jgi:hypothetical protein